MINLIILFITMNCFFSHAQEQDSLILVEEENKEMEEAFRKAKETLDSFIERATINRSENETYGAYVKLSEGATVEFLWVSDFQAYKNGYFIGVIITTPELLKNTKYGTTIGFKKEDIYDWQYYDKEADKLHGAFTHEPLNKKKQGGK